MAYYTISEVSIKGGYPVGEILELSMDVGVNRHGSFTYGGLISEAAAKQYIQKSADKQTVTLSLRGESEFCGYPQLVSIQQQSDHFYLRVTLVTSSQLMDTNPCNRFFQDVHNTCFNILTEAYADSKSGILTSVNAVDGGFKSILQYRETDWLLTLRLASRIGTVVFSNITSPEPQITLGVPKRQVRQESNDIVYTVGRDPARYRHQVATHDQTSYQNFLYYTMKSDNRYKLGDSINAGGKVLTVMEKSLVYTQGQVQELYILGHEQDFAVPFHHNKCIAGLELEGRVHDRSGQALKLLLDIDSERKDCGKRWFDYSPPTNNGMYSMPLEDEKVMLQWQSEADEDVLAVRPDRKNSQDMPNPNQRHFLMDHENHFMMVPGKVEYTNPVGHIQWLENNGLDVSTVQTISIFAGLDVNINSKSQVKVFSPERISTYKAVHEHIEEEDTITDTLMPKSSIDMISSGIDIKADSEVVLKSNTNDFKSSTLPERTETFKISEDEATKIAGATASVCNAQQSSPTASHDGSTALVSDARTS